jgi:hypothetical protein
MAISKHMVHIHIYCDGSLFSWNSRWGKPWNLERQREAFFVGLHTERAMFLYQRRWDKNLWSRISHPHKSRPCNSKADLAPKAAMPLMAVLACMASFPPELVGQRTANVNEIRERCL